MALLFTTTLLAGCSGSNGSNGSSGADGTNGLNGVNGTNASAFATLQGTVTDYYGNKVSGAVVTATVGTDTLTATADVNGAYSLQFAPGARTVTYAATGYIAFSQTVEIKSGTTATLNIKLNPVGRMALVAARADTAPAVPGAQVGLQANLLVYDPALKNLPITYQWTVLSGPAATFDAATSATPKATLASAAAFKKFLVELAAPFYKVNPDEAPVNVDRYQVVPISYDQAISQGNTTKLQVTATVNGVSTSAVVAVAATIPAVPSTGLQAVPVKAPVVLQGQFPFKNADGTLVFPARTTWAWTVAAPTGSSVTQLNDATTAYPDFTPDVPGDYAISEGGTVRLHVYAGTYAGALDAPATPAAGCTSCHDGATPGRFAAWLQTGHKEVIWAGIAEALPDGHYTKTCTPCHTVGNGRTGSAGFADKMALDNPDFAALQGDLNAEQDYWGLYPASAKVAGVQCENCHGPQTGTTKHMTSATGGDILSPRVSFSANVCATCHARAPKHGRFPQWAESGHASMATFTFNSNPDGSLSASCAVCHSAQGFKAFRKAMAQPGWIGNRSVVTLAAGAGVTTAEPITCAACHDSHSEGDKSTAGWSNLAAVGPTEGSTYILPSGFTAIGVGKGALCIACHNSRQGYSAAFSVGTGPGTTVNYPAAVYLHEDGDPKFGTLTSYGAPHEACQGDVLLGRNGYWLGAALRGSPQTRSKHSYITDTCVTCHMELTTLDLTLSEPGQTRHDFKATPDVCNKCHTAYSTESVASTFDASLDGLKTAVGTAILRLKYDDAIPAGTTAALVANRSGQVDVTTAGITRRWFLKTATGLDAYLSDPSNGGALPQGCVAGTAGTFDCTGFLAGAPGVTAIGASATQDATVTSSGVNGVIAKALWNTVLVQDDASHGVHNPSFSLEVIDATVQHVNGFTK